MMASTLADNSSTRPCASGRKGEQKIAPFASRRRYDCKRLHIADPVYPPIVINDGTAPSRWNHIIDRNILQRSEESRVGNECVIPCRFWRSPYHSKKKKT